MFVVLTSLCAFRRREERCDALCTKCPSSHGKVMSSNCWFMNSVPRQHCLCFCYCYVDIIVSLPSVLLCCWLGHRKGIWPVKNEWWGAGMVICLRRGADLHIWPS